MLAPAPPAGTGPGLALAAAGGATALAVSALLPLLSPTLVAIVLGLGLAASGRLRPAAAPGLGVAARRILRIGVALLGLQLALPTILGLGWPVLLGIVGVVGLGIAGTLLVATRLGIARDQALFVACGFSICGAAAVAALEGVRRPRGHSPGPAADSAAGPAASADSAVVVSLVVVCGSVAMLVVPGVALLLGLDPVAAGAWAGASVHEVGQVVVAGGLLGGAALQVAVAVKLGRVLLLAPVLTVLSVRARLATGTGVTEAGATGAGEPGVRPPLVPGFVAVFCLLVVARTVLPIPGAVLGAAEVVQGAALATAMFALGCSLSPTALRRAGRGLLALAAIATGWVALLGLPTALVLGAR